MILLLALFALLTPAPAQARACLADKYKEMRDLYEKPFLDGEGALKPEYQKKNVKYENTGQHDEKLAGKAEGKRGAGRSVKNSPLPDDAEAMWKRAFPEPGSNGKTWWAFNEECDCFYRFSGSVKGDKMVVHWNGMSKPGGNVRVAPAAGTEFFGAEGDVDSYARARRDATRSYQKELGKQIDRVTKQFVEAEGKAVRVVTEKGDVLEGIPIGITPDRGAVYVELDVGPPRGRVKVHLKDVREIGPATGASSPKIDVALEKTDVGPAPPTQPKVEPVEPGTKIEREGARGKFGETNKGAAPAFTDEPVNLKPSISQVAGEAMNRPAIHYRSPEIGQPAKQVAESVLKKPLGEEIGSGGFRRVYEHPTDPDKVVKVYDPRMGQQKSAQVVGEAIQRELAYEEVLQKFGFKVSKIDRNPELLERGIIVQEKVHGHPLGELLDREHPGRMRDPRLQAKYDEFMARAVKYEKALLEDQKSHYSWAMLGGTPSVPVGLDLGGGFSNVFVSDAGDFVLIDW